MAARPRSNGGRSSGDHRCTRHATKRRRVVVGGGGACAHTPNRQQRAGTVWAAAPVGQGHYGQGRWRSPPRPCAGARGHGRLPPHTLHNSRSELQAHRSGRREGGRTVGEDRKKITKENERKRRGTPADSHTHSLPPPTACGMRAPTPRGRPPHGPLRRRVGQRLARAGPPSARSVIAGVNAGGGSPLHVCTGSLKAIDIELNCTVHI